MENNNRESTPAEMLSALLGNEEVLAHLAPLLETLKASTPPAPNTNGETPPATNPSDSEPTASEPSAPVTSPPSLPPELIAKLPDVIATLAPALQSNKSTPKVNHDKRTALLLALRPYLSANRCEAIDYITRLGKLGDMLKNLNL